VTELMRAWPTLILGLLGGVVLGSVFFGGLWLTVSRLARGRGGALLVPVSLVTRLTVLSAGLLLAARLGTGALLSCGAGLVAARAVAVRLVWVPSRHLRNAEKGTHA
jgi:F1F0 ATPase subunit 2